jgi:2-polyprenyl-3-methyl-5-hydroxy-6-metoxy-1,4-benzoquinol methylase
LTVVECESCGLRFIGELLPPERIDALYEQEALADYFIELGPRHDVKFAPRLGELPTMGVAPDARILDVGCGAGDFTAMAAQAGYDAVGLDIAEPTIRAARTLHPAAEYRVASIAEIAASEPGAYDLVTLWDVIEHVVDPHAIVAECAGALRSGGLLALGTPNGESLYDTLVHVAYTTRWPIADRMLEQRFSDWHLQIWTAATLTRLVEEHDLEVVWARRHRELSAPPSLYVRQSGYAWSARFAELLDPLIEHLWPIRNKLTIYARKR